MNKLKPPSNKVVGRIQRRIMFMAFFISILFNLPPFAYAEEFYWYTSLDEARKNCSDPGLDGGSGPSTWHWVCPARTAIVGDMTYYAIREEADKACSIPSFETLQFVHAHRNPFEIVRYGCPPTIYSKDQSTFYARDTDAHKDCGYTYKNPTFENAKANRVTTSKQFGDYTYKHHNTIGEARWFECKNTSKSTKLEKILSYSGDLVIRRQDGSSTTLSKTTALSEGDRVFTGTNGYAKFLLADGSKLNIGTNTSVTIDRKRWNPITCPTNNDASKCNMALNLIKGSLRWVTGALGNKNRDNFKLSTANVALGIRGTDFQLAHLVQPDSSYPDSPLGTYAKINEGVIFLSNRAGTLDVSAGQFAFAPSQDDPPKLIKPIFGIFETSF